MLCGRYGAGYVLGLQGKDDPEGQGYLRLVASPKHFVGYDTEGMGPVASGCVGAGTGQPGTGCTFSGPTFNRHNFTANITAQELVEYYALPFKHAVIDGGAMGLMCKRLHGVEAEACEFSLAALALRFVQRARHHRE